MNIFPISKRLRRITEKLNREEQQACIAMEQELWNRLHDTSARLKPIGAELFEVMSFKCDTCGELAVTQEG